MNGEIAQFVALICFANAAIRGIGTPRFFPENSTFQFCNSVKFMEVKRSIFGKVTEREVCGTPNEWLSLVAKEGVAVRLSRAPQNSPGIMDRMAAAFVGGGGTWTIEVACRGGLSQFWRSRWEVWNQKAPDRKIWRVTYGLIGRSKTALWQGPGLDEVKQDFERALLEIHAFSARLNCGSFTDCFAKALDALNNPGEDWGYHKDLCVPGVCGKGAISLLNAAQHGWVFGGMGSWNDMGFVGEDGKEYDRVSENLFRNVNEAIEMGASSSALKSEV
jgi:hypothetical protein